MRFNIFFLLIANYCLAQNLVLNPSFEEFNKCPQIIGTFNANVTNWSAPNLGTTDFFNSCSSIVGVNNYNGYQIAKEGNAYAGIYVLAPKNYREYVQGEFIKKLEKGKQYEISFYISLADNSTHALNNLSVLFTNEKLGYHKRTKAQMLLSKPKSHKLFKNISEKYISPSKYTNGDYELYNIKNTTYYTDSKGWILVSFLYEAKGFENYFSIGNFQSDRKTKALKVLKTTRKNQQFSYYYIDMLSVEPLEKEKPEKVLTPTKLPVKEVNQIYTFKNVLFDFDKSELLNASYKELNQLYEYLKEFSNFKIEIYGHTDNVGLEKRNKELSELRAKAVSNYLISLGLDSKRIKSFGFGSSKPITTNATPSGRQTNRRVAFKLIKN